MRSVVVKFLGCLLLAVGVQAWAGPTLKLDAAGRRTLEIGADEQLRLEHWGNGAYMGPEHKSADEGGNAVEYFRMRERVWGKLTLSPDVLVYGRITHRWQYFTAHPKIFTTNTSPWHYPDEVIVDNLYLNLDKIGGSGWSLRGGRFDLADAKGKPLFGNGMLFYDGTGRDGGRTLYFDGALATWQGEKDIVRLAGLFGKREEWFPAINDQGRQLRRGDSYIGGGAWTHQFCKQFQTEASFFHVNIRDNVAHAEEAALEVPAIRVFGELHPLVEYSVEYAREYGSYQGGVKNGAMQDACGSMLDARLNLKTPEGTALQPVFKLEYTMFSGDSQATTGKYEGWHPLFAEYPIWREELYPQTQKWTNLHQYRLACELTVRNGDKSGVGKLVVTPVWATLWADRADAGTGGGEHVGELPSLFVDYQVKSWWKASLQSSYFLPGNYFADRQGGEWIRLEMTFTY